MQIMQQNTPWAVAFGCGLPSADSSAVESKSSHRSIFALMISSRAYPGLATCRMHVRRGTVRVLKAGIPPVKESARTNTPSPPCPVGAVVLPASSAGRPAGYTFSGRRRRVRGSDELKAVHLPMIWQCLGGHISQISPWITTVYGVLTVQFHGYCRY